MLSDESVRPDFSSVRSHTAPKHPEGQHIATRAMHSLSVTSRSGSALGKLRKLPEWIVAIERASLCVSNLPLEQTVKAETNFATRPALG